MDLIEKGQLVRVIDHNGRTYTGILSNIALQHDINSGKFRTQICITQDKRFVETEGLFGKIPLWLDMLDTIMLWADDKVCAMPLLQDIYEETERRLDDILSDIL